MLQDLPAGRLENEFRNLEATDEDLVVCICKNTILVKREEGNLLSLPSVAEVKQWAREKAWQPWGQRKLQYVFRMLGENYVIWMGQAGECPDERYGYESARTFRYIESKNLCYAAMTAWHLYHWYRNNRYCGACGGNTVHDEKERMVRCPQCGNMIFPRISPAVIVGVTNGEKLLLSKYAGRGYTNYALIAGYTEIGETMEQTVQREVLEEVGLKVKNIRYYKSQPWGIDGNVLMGFYCDLDGDDTIHLDEQELALAEWHDRNALPIQDDGISLTREMIRTFGEGKEPK